MHRILSPRLAIGLFVVILLDVYCLSWIFPPQWTVDIWAVLLVYYCVFYQAHPSLLFSALTGFLCDFFGPGIFGVTAISMTLGAIFLTRCFGMLNRDRWYVQIMMVFCTTLCVRFSEIILTSLLLRETVWLTRFMPWVISSGALTALLSPWLLKGFSRLLGVAPRQYELFS